MYKLAKWAYKRGVMAERNRIKKLIAEHRQRKPEKPSRADERGLDDYHRSLNLWKEVNWELDKLTEPHRNIEEQMLAPIDEDSL